MAITTGNTSFSERSPNVGNRQQATRDLRDSGAFSFGGDNNFRDDNRQTFVTGDRFGPPTGSDPGFLANVPVVGSGLAISSVLQELLGPPTGMGDQTAGGDNNFRDDERNQLLQRAGF